MLEDIGMIWDARMQDTERWNQNYELARKYYEHNVNLNIPKGFKTCNGYDYDENGVNLGTWIQSQRQAYKGTGDHKMLSEKQIKMLEDIGMVWYIKNVNGLSQSEQQVINNLEEFQSDPGLHKEK
jgi:hypothetical protein